MKTAPFFCTSLIALALPFAVNAQMVPANDRVRVEVRTNTDLDEKELAKTAADRVTQKKTLTILLSGKSKRPETRVIKWTAYGRNLRSNDLKVLDTGEVKLDLVRGAQTAKSKEVSTTYTPAHAETAHSRVRGRHPAKHVEASGVKYAGYTVQVLDGEKVVGEVSDPAGIAAKK